MSEKRRDPASQDSSNFVRRGYWIEKPIAKAIKVMAALEDLNEYEVVNIALKKGIPKKYFEDLE